MDPVLRKRLSMSAIFVSLTLATIFLSPEWFFFVIVQTFGLIGLNEFLAMAEKKTGRINRIAGLIFGAIIPFATYYNAEAAVLSLAALVLFVMNFDKNAPRDTTAFLSIAVTIFGLVYIPVLFSHLIKLRHLGYGSQLIFFTILLAKGGDAGAYFVGRKLGKEKLIEHISPNKSVEGAIGGLGVTILLALISKSFLPFISFGHLILLGILIAVVAALGDLAESLVKREVGVKDSGQIPGLGGILDMLDSLLFTIPLVYYYVLHVL